MDTFAVETKRRTEEIYGWLEEIKQENRLSIFFSDMYLRKQATHMSNIIRLSSAMKIFILIDKETLSFLFLLDEKALHELCFGWYADVSQKKAEIPEGSTLSYVIKEDVGGGNLLRCTVRQIEGNVLLCNRRVKRAEDIKTIKRLAENHESFCQEIQEAVDLFISEHSLLDYYVGANNALETRVKDLMDWIRSCARSKDLFISFDLTKPYLLRQLLTGSSYNIEVLLTNIVGHKCLRNTTIESGAPHKKRRIHIACKQFRKNNAAFVEQLQHNADLFSNASSYSSLLNKRNKDASFIDVCVVKLEDCDKTPQGMLILDKSDYEMIREKVTKMKRFINLADDESDDDLATMTPEKVRQARAVQDVITKSIDENLDTVFICPYKDEVDIDEEMKQSVAKRTREIFTMDTGLPGALGTMNDTLSQLFSDARRTYQKKGAVFFPGPLMMTKEMIGIENFNDITTSSSRLVKKLMKSASNRSKIQQHRDKNRDVDFLSIKHTNRTLSRGVLPCMVDPKFSYVHNGNNNIIINNHITYTHPTTVSLSDQVVEIENEPSKKRKRNDSVEVIHERYKRIRGSNERRVGDDDIAIFKHENLGIVNPDLHDVQTCPVCEKLKTLSRFSKVTNRRTKDGVLAHHINIYNICEACMRQSRKVNKEST